MSLASLAEEIQAAVATFIEQIKPSYTTESLLSLSCINMIDPAGLFEDSGQTGLFICPVTNQYNVDNSNRRERIKSLSKTPIIACILSVPYKTTTPGDVAEWAEVAEVLNFREAVEIFIATQKWSATIQTIEAEPPLEINLGIRRFMGICEFTFEAMGC